MKWIKETNEGFRIPIKSWCSVIEEGAIQQAKDVAELPITVHHVALMPDCHVGYGMPVGGVIACDNAVIPYAVGVDIGCGMIAVQTDISADMFSDMKARRELMESIKQTIPIGEGHSNKTPQKWEGFEKYIDSLKSENNLEWPSKLDRLNLGSLGGGNHFIELQKSADNKIWLMIHSGSRHLGQKVAKHYWRQAVKFSEKENIQLPNADLAFLPADLEEGQNYISDMNFALEYAQENRKRMMAVFKEKISELLNGKVKFLQEVNIHHNYAALENHFGKDLWVHRKGATSAKDGEIGIIPGSMGTPSYIVRGKGNLDSFKSCSHGAGRAMSRSKASKNLTVEESNKDMEGIVFDRWNKNKKCYRKDAEYDLSEAPQAYKNIESVIESELDLIEPIVKLYPLAVLKG